MRKVIAFDLEIVKEIPEGVDWKDVRPLGISCVAFLRDHLPLSELWFHGQYSKESMSGAMTKDELSEMVMAMWDLVMHQEYTVLTWNGLSFDFDVLAEESGMYDECKELAMNHIDMMFHFFCVKGYMIGLNTAAHGLDLGGKMGGMSGALAPQLWASPHLKDRLKVLRYVHQDVVTTLEIYEKSTELKSIPWIARSGKPNIFHLLDGWKTVKECLELPLPDQSWMDDPKTKEEFYAWTEK